MSEMRVTTAGQVVQGTRRQIVEALKTNGEATILELAAKADVSPVTIRHHLSSLQADGLAEAKVERRSVGRPHHVYYLTDAGEELFPRLYLGLIRRLLAQIKTKLPEETVSLLFENMANEIIEENMDRFEGKSAAERMAALAEILEAEGFMVRWEEQAGSYRIIEHNCPYRKLGIQHPDICRLDQTLISTVMGAPAERQSCLLQGDHRCVYVVRAKDQVRQSGV